MKNKAFETIELLPIKEIKIGDLYQGDDWVCRVSNIVKGKYSSLITLQSITNDEYYIVKHWNGDQTTWLNEFKRIEQTEQTDDNAECYLFMCGL